MSNEQKQKIVIGFHRVGDTGRFQIFVDGVRRYSGRTFNQKQAEEKLAILGRRCEITFEEGASLQSSQEIEDMKKQKKTTQPKVTKSGTPKAKSIEAAYQMLREQPEIAKAFSAKVTKGKKSECWPIEGKYPEFYVAGHLLRAPKAAMVIADPDADLTKRYKTTCGNLFCTNPAHIVVRDEEVKETPRRGKKAESGVTA